MVRRAWHRLLRQALRPRVHRPVLCLLILLGTLVILRDFHWDYLLPAGAFFAYAFYYVFLVPQVAAWYMVPFGALGCLMLVLSIAALLNRFVSPRLIPCVAYSYALLISCRSCFFFPP